MTTTPLRVAVVIGSTREGRFGDTITNWFVSQAGRRTDIELDIIDLATANLPVTFSRTPSPAYDEFVDRVDRAEAFVVVTPEYNHSYPASLKHAIDLAGEQWYRKPVGFVSYGGLSGGLRAVEHLRGVFAELRTVTIRETVSFHGAFSLFDESGAMHEPMMAIAATDLMLDDLTWWGLALRNAKAADTANA